MNHPLVDEFKEGRCEWCCEETTVYVDNGRCEQCDTEVIHCYVCDQDQHRDNKCRHVFEDQYFQWSGAGTRMTPENNVRQSFMDLLTAMPSGFATDLRKAIRSGKFYTWIVAPMIGGGGILELNGMDYRTGRKYGDAMLALGEYHPDDEGLADGYRWLASLYKRTSPKSNTLTVRWIDSWLDERHWALHRLADDGCPIFSR